MTRTIGFIGLGKMGQNMVLHLLEQGIDVVGYNRTKEVTEEFQSKVESLPAGEAGRKTNSAIFTSALNLSTFYSLLSTPRIIWLMVPNGQPVDDVIAQLLDAGCTSGDVIIDGGNCLYTDSVRRSQELSQKGIHFIDCGTSGGLDGARQGACLMLGGDTQHIAPLSWLWDALAVKNGWTHVGPSGAGHFVKAVHNGVEYGIDQALGEGFEILSRGPYQLDLAAIAHNWSHGSVVRSWLTELLAQALSKDPTLSSFSGSVGGGQTGTWALNIAQEHHVAAPVLRDALLARADSQKKPTFAGKVVSALRFGYGGHK